MPGPGSETSVMVEDATVLGAVQRVRDAWIAFLTWGLMNAITAARRRCRALRDHHALVAFVGALGAAVGHHHDGLSFALSVVWRNVLQHHVTRFLTFAMPAHRVVG